MVVCAGNGHDPGCMSDGCDFFDLWITDIAGNRITQAIAGTTVIIWAHLKNDAWWCENFHLAAYDGYISGDTLLACYLDRMGGFGETWAVPLFWDIPSNISPGNHTILVYANLKKVQRQTNLFISAIPACSPDGIQDCIGYDLYECIGGQWKLVEANSKTCGYIPPECSPEGSLECVGYDLYECQNNKWVLKESNSPTCGYECSPDGITKCIGYDLYECQNNKWVLKESNSPTCGYTPPVCSPDGITKCEGYDLYECQNGQWVLIEANSPTCGYTPPVCSPDGITKCEGYDLYECQNGQWVLKESNSPTCGYTPPLPCEEIINKANCLATTGCHWYQKYIWESEKCHSTEQNMMMDYLPFIIAGVGGAAILIALLIPKKAPTPRPT